VRDGDGPRHRVREPLAAELEADAGRAALDRPQAPGPPVARELEQAAVPERAT